MNERKFFFVFHHLSSQVNDFYDSFEKKGQKKIIIFFKDKKNKYDNHKESVNMTGTNKIKKADNKRRFRKKPRKKRKILTNFFLKIIKDQKVKETKWEKKNFKEQRKNFGHLRQC